MNPESGRQSSLGGRSVSRQQLSPSASVSQQSSNLFGKQTTLLSWVSWGLRVSSILFSYRGPEGGEKGRGTSVCYIPQLLLVAVQWWILDQSEEKSSMFYSIESGVALVSFIIHTKTTTDIFVRLFAFSVNLLKVYGLGWFLCYFILTCPSYQKWRSCQDRWCLQKYIYTLPFYCSNTMG